jgi:hypothetical protein
MTSTADSALDAGDALTAGPGDGARQVLRAGRNLRSPDCATAARAAAPLGTGQWPVASGQWASGPAWGTVDVLAHLLVPTKARMATATGWAGLRLKVMALDSSLPGALCTDLSVTEGCRLSLHERCARGTGTAGLVILAVVVAGRSPAAACPAAGPGGRRPGVEVC